MADGKIEKLVKICCDWNHTKITAGSAMNKIWVLFEKENLKEWNKPKKGRNK